MTLQYSDTTCAPSRRIRYINPASLYDFATILLRELYNFVFSVNHNIQASTSTSTSSDIIWIIGCICCLWILIDCPSFLIGWTWHSGIADGIAAISFEEATWLALLQNQGCHSDRLLPCLVKKPWLNASSAVNLDEGSYARRRFSRSMRSPAEWSTCCITRFW